MESEVDCMNRMLALLLMLLPVMALADAESYTLSSTENAYYECVDFDGELTGEAQEIFGQLLREGDRVLCGTICKTLYRNFPGVLQKQRALLAVEREGLVLLMGANHDDTQWRTCIETDRFIPAGTAFDITTKPAYSNGDILVFGDPTIVCGEESYRLEVHQNGSVSLRQYERAETDGSTFILTPGAGYSISIEREGEADLPYHEHGMLPDRLAAWTMDMFPKSVTEAKIFLLDYALDMEEDEAFISGGNFREQPTSASRSWGQYSAKAQILGSRMGTVEPWYNVRVGSLTGWVSANYVVKDPYESVRYYGNACGVRTVARADGDILLRVLPDGETVMNVPAGTLMHVIQENEGWAHVIIPRGEISWLTDWDGTYGFVKLSEVTTGVSIADVQWK